MNKKGKLIVIEGTDASGKETQSKLLVERLNKESIGTQMISFPRYETSTGRIVGECYLGKKLTAESSGKSWFEDATSLDPLTASLYYAADRREAIPFIRDNLDSGINLISNRYVESNMAHQGGKIRNNEQRLEFFTQLDRLEHEVLGIPRTDKVIFLYMPWQVAKELKAKRGGHQDAHEANDEHLKDAERTYLELAELRGWTKIECAPTGNFPPRSVEDISEEVYTKTREIIRL